MNSRCLWVGVFALFVISFYPVLATEEPDPIRPDPMLTLGGLRTESYSEGIGDIVLPLYFDGQGLVFLNPRMSFTDRSEEEYNIGIGYRHMIRDHRAVLGANMYYDRRETRLGASFDQVGFGVEYLSHFIDARANLYLPLDGKELVRTLPAEERSVSSRSHTSMESVWGDPYGTGHDVLQDYEILRTTRTTTKQTTTTRYFREYEVALRGWDAEIGVRLPIEKLDRYLRLKPFAGYYRYEGRHGVDTIEGFRARLEVHVRPSFYIDAVYYPDDALTGGHYSIGAYVSMPFDLVNIGKGRGPFAGASEQWAAGRARGDIRSRLAEPVKRDPQIRSRVTEPEEQEGMTTKTAVSTSRAKTETVDSGTEEVATDITFVDKTRGDDSNPGTYEAPKETVQGGVNEPRSMVFVFREGNPYNETVTLTEGVVLRGEGRPIPAFGGKSFGSGVHPTIDATGMGAQAIRMTANTSVSGFRIHNEFGHGIYSSTGENLEIIDNRIHKTVNGVYIEEAGGDVNVFLGGNQVYDNMGFGVHIEGTGASGTYFVDARHNAVWDNLIGMSLVAQNYDTVLAIIDDLHAYGNSLFGLNAQLDAQFASLLSLTDIHAHNNAVFGVTANVTAHRTAWRR